MEPKETKSEKWKRLRLLAKQGDAEAKAQVAKQDAAVKASKAKAKASGVDHDAINRRRRNERFKRDKDLAANGDKEAAQRAEHLREVNRGQKIRARRKKGVLPREQYQIRRNAAKVPEYIQRANNVAYQKTYKQNRRAQLRDAAAAGDPQAIYQLEEMRKTQAVYYRRWKDKKEAAAHRYKQASITT